MKMVQEPHQRGRPPMLRRSVPSRTRSHGSTAAAHFRFAAAPRWGSSRPTDQTVQLRQHCPLLRMADASDQAGVRPGGTRHRSCRIGRDTGEGPMASRRRGTSNVLKGHAKAGRRGTAGLCRQVLGSALPLLHRDSDAADSTVHPQPSHKKRPPPPPSGIVVPSTEQYARA